MEPREAFCEDAADILSDESIGDSPERLRAQMISVQDAAARLDERDSEDLLILIEQLNETLDAAVVGEATLSGWGSVDVVHEVEELCPQASGLMSWIVQP